MLYTSMQYIKFTTYSKDNFNYLIKYLTHDAKGIETKIMKNDVDLTEDYQNGFLKDISATVISSKTDYNNNTIEVYCIHKLISKYEYFVNNKHLILYEVSVSGYLESEKCSLYETYKINKHGIIEYENYNTIEDKIRFFNNIGCKDHNHILDSFSLIAENVSELEQLEDIMYVLNYKIFIKEKNNLYNKKFNKYSLIMFTFLKEDLNKYSYNEIDTMFNLASKNTLYSLLVNDEFELVYSFIKYRFGQKVPYAIIEIVGDLINNSRIERINLNYILFSYNNDSIKISRKIYDEIDDKRKIQYLRMIDNCYCDKLMLFEKKMNK